MSKAVLYMSMSLDGFIAGPDDGPGNGLGDGGHRLHEWLLPGPGDYGSPGGRRPPGGCEPRGHGRAHVHPGRWSWAGGPSSSPAAGAATTTTASRSSS